MKEFTELKLKAIRSGHYYEEIARKFEELTERKKAAFCIDLAQGFKLEAESAEERIQQGIGDKTDLNLNKDLVTSSRSIAANVLCLAANCHYGIADNFFA
jgi:hypothetical protein